MKMTFEQFWDEVLHMQQLDREAEYLRDAYDDYGAAPGCECGCGGDTFDWDAQADAYDRADELDREYVEIYNKLKEIWEAR